MFGSFPPSPLVGLRLQSLLGPGSRHCYGIISLIMAWGRALECNRLLTTVSQQRASFWRGASALPANTRPANSGREGGRAFRAKTYLRGSTFLRSTFPMQPVASPASMSRGLLQRRQMQKGVERKVERYSSLFGHAAFLIGRELRRAASLVKGETPRRIPALRN